MPAPRRRRPAGFPRVYAGARRRLIWRLVANGVAQAATAGVLAWSLRAAVAAAGRGELHAPALAALAGGGALLLALRIAEAAWAERLGQEYVMRVRLRLFARMAARPSDASPGYGIAMTRMIGDLNSLRNWVSRGLARAIVAGISLTGLLAALAVLDPLWALALGGMLPLFVAATLGITPRLRERVRESRRRRGRLARNLGEKLLALRTVRHFGRTERELRRVRHHSRQLRDVSVGRARWAHALRALPQASLPLALAAAVGLSVSTGRGVEDLVVAVLLGGMIAAGLVDLARAWDYRLAFEEGRRRIGTALGASRLREHPQAREIPGEGPVAIEFEGLRLIEGGEALDLRVEAGERVLVCGRSGSGKSQLLALAARHRDPDRGEVRIGGVPARRLRLESLHDAVALVAPDLPLLRGSVRENLMIAGGEPGWTAELTRACALDGTDSELEHGLETRVGEGGRNLPLGLRARIALARAAVARPRLLLVDDPVFAVDPRARRALARVAGSLRATLLVVGPRERPPLEVDRVLCLDPGAPQPLRAGESR